MGGRFTAYLGLGANLGEREETIRRAIGALAGHPAIEVNAVSALLETEPVGGPPDQPPYLNAAAAVQTSLSAGTLLAVCLDVEQFLGRERTERWGPRTIDIDLLLYGDAILDEPGLTVPHMELFRRRFVLEPLAEIAPNARHPLLGVTIEELLARLDRLPEGGEDDR